MDEASIPRKDGDVGDGLFCGGGGYTLDLGVGAKKAAGVSLPPSGMDLTGGVAVPQEREGTLTSGLVSAL